MQEEEQAIRRLVAQWQTASAEGDIDVLQQLMADDVIFLMPGQAPIRGKQAFLAAFSEGMKHFRIEAQAEVREVQVGTDLAYCWTYLSVTLTPFNGGLPMHRSGDSLTVLRKQGDAWVILRDANLLTPRPAHLPA